MAKVVGSNPIIRLLRRPCFGGAVVVPAPQPGCNASASPPDEAAPMKRSLSVLIALLAFAAVAAGPAAAARKPKPVKFLATFTGERHIAWNEPRWETADRQCDSKYWEYGEGEETWSVKSKSVKVLALGSGSSALLKFGTWSEREPSATFGME